MQHTNECASVAEPFCKAGLYLVQIPQINGQPTKAPRAKGWNKPISPENPAGYSANMDDFNHCENSNLGVYHDASQTLALDLDDLELSIQVIKETTGFNLLDRLHDEARAEIKSPKANRGKLLFKLPDGFGSAGLRQFKQGKTVIFELRSGNCQDVIYGQHPDGGAYQFVGDPAKIPLAPSVLLDFLQHWEDWKPCFDSALGIEVEQPKIKRHKPPIGRPLAGRRNPIEEFNQNTTVQSVLLTNGYKAAGKNRFIRPGSSSKAPGVFLLNDCTDGIERVFSHGGDALNDGFAHDAFDCYRILECSGDEKTALNWSAEITKHNQRLFMKNKAQQMEKQSTPAKV